jgi:hypothetical protein
MWKLIVGFIAFAALALFILTKSGGQHRPERREARRGGWCA